MALGQGARGRGYPIGGGQKIQGRRIQMQRSCHQKQGEAMALQED